MPNIDPDHTRMAFGFMILGILGMLALFFGLGKVEEKTSYGLIPIITALVTIAGAFAQWAFSNKPPKPPDSK
jgi:hypothetical protein